MHYGFFMQKSPNCKRCVEPSVHLENCSQCVEPFQIDTLVSELYGLDRKEVVTVLESLNVMEIAKNNSLMKFVGA